MTLLSEIPAPAPAALLPMPTPAEVVDLQAHHGYPCVSILAGTAPGPQMTRQDAARLEVLVREAEARLRSEPDLGAAEDLAAALDALVVDARSRPTRQAVALYASAGHVSSWSLPVGVRDRVVVDPTFATRDLVRSLHRTPRHVVLLLADHEARLFDGGGDVLLPALGSAFPLSVDPEREPSRHAVPSRGPKRGSSAPDDDGFLRTVDSALGTYLRLHPAPLVIVGAERTVAQFRHLSRNVGRLAGTVRGSHLRTPLAKLVPLIRPVLDTYLLSRQDEALALLERRTGFGRTALGMPAVWLASRTERPEMLVVDSEFFYPARLDEGGDLIIPADDVNHPEVIDDAVDEVIETVLRRGGWVALTARGALDHCDRIALTLRT